ncbi:hypothetical protein T440DRAFT_406295 [Plenodomus tracheiphilus IPT5]|uniref:Uncharacterized protein n=1 Tax=Plenodomus tracheiphilus IPT5 TaxID=1408161 RepID=A0A6A7ASF8_9PLEO|nr:hypothetical protein T440DRAFT_406295 [Plenodomus tracheiphilus IPT5]
MPSPNSFTRTTIPYHRVSKEFSENDSERSPTDTRPSTLPDEIDNLIAKQAHRRSRRRHAFCYALVCFISLLIGSIISQLFFRFEVEIDGYPAPFGHATHILKDVVWQRNETFQAPPSAESEKAWMALMPKGKGSIRYPKDSPLEKGMTVFHGIHCLVHLPPPKPITKRRTKQDADPLTNTHASTTSTPPSTQTPTSSQSLKHNHNPHLHFTYAPFSMAHPHTHPPPRPSS